MAQGIHSLARGPKIEISGNWGQMKKSADEHVDHPKVFDREGRGIKQRRNKTNLGSKLGINMAPFRQTF